jgi:hypothetical protein
MALADYSDLFGCISSYHSLQKTTRISGWDRSYRNLSVARTSFLAWQVTFDYSTAYRCAALFRHKGWMP